MQLLLSIIWLFLILPILFQFLYIKTLESLKVEANSIKPIKTAKEFEATIFNQNKKKWLIKGSSVDLSDAKEVVIDNCYARNFIENVAITAQKAFYYPITGKIKLIGKVKVEKFNLNNKPIETVFTDLAFIDLTSDKIYGPSKVILKRGKVTLVGKGFIYDTKIGSFKILSNVQTFINSP